VDLNQDIISHWADGVSSVG